jgi:hypothetical protein
MPNTYLNGALLDRVSFARKSNAENIKIIKKHYILSIFIKLKKLLRLTETMRVYNDFYRCTECAKAYNDDQRRNAKYVQNNARFKCPEKNCKKALTFREFINRKCCDVVMRSSETAVNFQNNRAEFQDLTKMMKELEVLEKEENEAKNLVENKQKELDAATAQYSKKIKSRELLQVKLANSFSETSDMLLDKKG